MGSGSGEGHEGGRQKAGRITILSCYPEAGHCLRFQDTLRGLLTWGLGSYLSASNRVLVLAAFFDMASLTDLTSSMSPLCCSLIQTFLSSASSWTYLQNAFPLSLLCIWFIRHVLL